MLSARPTLRQGDAPLHIALTVGIGLVVFAAGAVGSPVSAARSSRIANYRIMAAYDASEHTLSGHEILTWRNTAAEAAPDLYFHLYLNAFANSRSSFARETENTWVDWLDVHPHGWGYIAVNAIRVGGDDVTDRMQFVHPDDDNIDDRTVFRLPLKAPVGPGRTVDIEIEFVAKLPKIAARSGYAGPFAFVAQWFPKIGVYENGAWNCHQYHRTTEFFADFGVYDVTLTVPREGVVGATGTLRDERDNGDGTRTLHFVAEDVHDFAWTIDPRYRVIERRVEGITVRLLMQPNHLDQVERHVQAAAAAIKCYAEWVGDYPYPQLTIVDPGPGGGGAGGMEYPMLITVGTTWWMPNGVRAPEMVTVHEFGHQYWYGVVANNEFEEAWLDEGLNSYVEGRIMDAVYGPGSYLDLFGVHGSSVAYHRLEYLMAAQHDPMVRPAWRFLDRGSYASVSYAKTALVLDTLDAYLGHDALRAGLHTYFERWRFKHPRASDLMDALNDGAAQDVTWYLEQVVSGTGLLDYAVTRVSAEETHAFAGYPFVGPQVGAEVAAQEPDEQGYRSEVVVERLGTVRVPVDVEVGFDDGAKVHEHWDGRDRWKRFEYTGKQRVEWAAVDPNSTMPLDCNRLNNSRMREAGTSGIVRLSSRWGFWFQNLVYVLTGL
jgi:hypothetical protein